MGRNSGPSEPWPRAGTAAAIGAAAADRVTGLFQSWPLDGPVGGRYPTAAEAVAGATSPAGVAGSAGSGGAASWGPASPCGGWGGAGWTGTPAVGAGWEVGGAGSLVFRGRPGWAVSGLPARTGRQRMPQVEVGATEGSAVAARAGEVGKKPKARARTAADAVVETAWRAGADGVIATFRCAQSPHHGFLVSPVVFYSSLRGRKSAAAAPPQSSDLFSPGFRAAAPPGFSGLYRVPPRSRGPE